MIVAPPCIRVHTPSAVTPLIPGTSPAVAVMCDEFISVTVLAVPIAQIRSITMRMGGVAI